ncbi:MAG: family 16 glycosylhydrolase [Dysgonamonadaceae bacterium]|jgi:beta-glucanase (GH16 family)|nr:family 16 glycosylhydrolase [Dysgonamonadaceae bacterium]
MKTISFLLLLLASSFVFTSPAQEDVVIDDFESGDKGWSSVEWADFEIVDNPCKDAVNSSNKVMQITRHKGTNNWAGIILRDKEELTFGSFPGQYRYIHVKVLKTTNGDVGFKLEKDAGIAPHEESKTYSPSEAWQEIVFDMEDAAGATYDDYFIMPDRTNNLSEDITIYIDDIVLKPDPDADEREIEELPGTFEPVWVDEFNGSYDPAIWSPQVIDGNDLGNGELQYYTGLPKNIFTRDGNLVLKAYKEDSVYEWRNYTSGKLWSQNKKTVKYGRVEARFKLPKGRGTWPAIWMMPQDDAYGVWPNSGEIDIMEFVGYEIDKVYGTVHRGAGSGSNGAGNYTSIGNTDEFHVVRIDWEPGYIKWYLDGRHFHTYYNINKGSNQWPFDREFYVILNFAVGGNWGGAGGVDDAIWPQEFLIDYVRVYQKIIPVDSVSLNKNSVTLSINASESLRATVYPANANQDVTWESRNPNIADVNGNGEVTAKAAGTVDITVTADGGKKDTCTVHVTNNDANLSNLTVSGGTLMPSFGPAILNYTVSVANSVTGIEITAVTRHPAAAVTINGATTKTTVIQNLAVGNNPVAITVTAEDRITTKDYTVKVTREALTGIPPVVDPAARVYLDGQILHVDSPTAEQVNIYSVDGTLLYRLKKPAGKTSFVISTRSQLLIVRGSSGWTGKLIM